MHSTASGAGEKQIPLPFIPEEMSIPIQVEGSDDLIILGKTVTNAVAANMARSELALKASHARTALRLSRARRKQAHWEAELRYLRTAWNILDRVYPLRDNPRQSAA